MTAHLTAADLIREQEEREAEERRLTKARLSLRKRLDEIEYGKEEEVYE